MDDRTDEDLLVAIAVGPGALAEFYRRHVAKIVGVDARRFDDPPTSCGSASGPLLFSVVLGNAVLRR